MTARRRERPWRSALVRRELGLHGDRALWRTRIGRVLLFIAFVLALDAIHFAWRARLWDAIILTDINSAVVAARRLETRELILFTWLCAWLSLAAFLSPLWMCVRAWSRLDRDPGWDQIRLTGVRPAELIWGKTVVWFGVWVAMIVVAQVVVMGLTGPMGRIEGERSLFDFMATSGMWQAQLLQDDLMPTTLLWCQIQTAVPIGMEILRFGAVLAVGAALFLWVSVISLRFGSIVGLAAVVIGGIPGLTLLAHGAPYPEALNRLLSGDDLAGPLCTFVTVAVLPMAVPRLLKWSRRLCEAH